WQRTGPYYIELELTAGVSVISGALSDISAADTMPDAIRLSGIVLSLQCRENRPVFSACSPHAVSGLGF
ncbi:hypothetical protein, partial [Escherichia coli]|uniref:hypothetical protein n=1 Tax=Escherichia coli TaxID=562 RepID=UPI00254F0252